jgi:hypothetical protein
MRGEGAHESGHRAADGACDVGDQQHRGNRVHSAIATPSSAMGYELLWSDM